MIEPRRFPFGFQVARFALGAEGSAMHVISRVTSVTRCRRFGLMFPVGMAGVTFDFTVSAAQLEFCIPVMIELRRLPLPLRMAVRAIRPKPSLVHIVISVAANAGCGQFFRVQGRLVACGTFGNAVGLSQRKMCVPLVVKTHIFR